jgi:lipopolysaccharide/colanic/teichoic acid biosynthesis glycosyltransferase
MATTLYKKARQSNRRKVRAEVYEGTPITLTVVPKRYFEWKSTADVCTALLLLLPALPLMAVACIIVRLTSRGPAIFRQRRVGRGGELFCLYKIRSMNSDAETRMGPTWSQGADPRVTRIGRLLRRYHLDELPQLFNVLKGQMSLVGPRPERPEFVEVLQRQVPGYMNRLAVRPGITGLAQLNLPPDSDLVGVRRKLILDLEYIETAGPWLDIRLIACTALRFFKLPFLKIFGLRRRVLLPSGNSDNQFSANGERAVTLRQIQRNAHDHVCGKSETEAGVRRGRKGDPHRQKPR